MSVKHYTNEESIVDGNLEVDGDLQVNSSILDSDGDEYIDYLSTKGVYNLAGKSTLSTREFQDLVISVRKTGKVQYNGTYYILNYFVLNSLYTEGIETISFGFNNSPNNINFISIHYDYDSEIGRYIVEIFEL